MPVYLKIWMKWKHSQKSKIANTDIEKIEKSVPWWHVDYSGPFIYGGRSDLFFLESTGTLNVGFAFLLTVPLSAPSFEGLQNARFTNMGS